MSEVLRSLLAMDPNDVARIAMSSGIDVDTVEGFPVPSAATYILLTERLYELLAGRPGREAP